MNCSPARGGVATLRDFGNKDESDDEDEDDDDVEKYYAGGQKRYVYFYLFVGLLMLTGVDSGQMIQYPKEKGANKKDVVGDVFESAKRY